MLAQQTSKFVMKCVSKLSQGTKLNGMEKYLMDIAVALKQQLPLWKNGKTPVSQPAHESYEIYFD